MPSDPFNPDGLSAQKVDSADACPPKSIWHTVYEGTLAEEAAITCLLHSFHCRKCSDLLARASALQDTEPSAAEEALLRELTTGTEAGQFRLAKLLHDTAAPRRTIHATSTSPRRPFLWPTLALTTAALACTAFLAVPLILPTSDRRLLAAAYDKDRLSELRIPGSDAGPLASPTRGVPTGASSSELLRVKLRAQQQFEKNPNDARLRQTLGEIAIVEHDGEGAHRSLEMAEALNPQLPGLRFDLASAYFEIAETTGNPLNYGRAADLFSQHLESVHGKDPVALFDRGLCWERQSVFSEALKDFTNALALESDAHWRQEIEHHLQLVEQKLHPGGGVKADGPDLTPAGFLLTAAPDADIASDHYELYLDAAMKGWIARRGESREIDDALERLAAIGVKHQDAWLHDWLRTPAGNRGQEADRQLSAAVVANARGDAATALPSTQQAAMLYRKANNRAGYLRAEVETAYTLNRMMRVNDCRKRALSLLSEPDLKSSSNRYSWIGAHLMLVAAACKSGAGDLAGDLNDASRALQIATDSHLPLEELRSRFFIEEAYAEEGSTSLAWKIATAGLAQSAELDNAARTHAFLIGLSTACAGLRLPWTAKALAEAAVEAASRTGNARDYGYALDLLGKAQSGVGDFAGADRSFDAAYRLLTQTGAKSAGALYKLDVEADRAASLALRGQLPTAMIRMTAAQMEATGTGSAATSLHQYTESADLLHREGRTQESLHNALLAIAGAEQTLAPLHTELQRRAWETRTAQAYELAVQCLLESGQTEQALRLWEWHQVAGFRPADVAMQSEKDSPLPATPELPRIPSGQVTLVFARVLDRYVAWSITGDTPPRVRAVSLSATPDRIDSLASAFSRLCADRSSSLVDLGVLGKDLYGDLLAPFEAEIRSASVVRLEIDDSLRAIPFAALPTPEGRYLVERQAVVLLPTWWVLHQASTNAIDRKMHLLVVNGAALPATYDETREIASRFHNSEILQQAQVDTRHLLALLPRTDIVHYNGHGSTDSEQSGLILGSSHELLTAETLAGLSLKRCRLAVLAACETDGAIGNSMEDSANLPHALLSAGVPAVVATQWAIDSQSTDRLMVNFYDDLSKGQQIATALQSAQEFLLSTPNRHPYFWSAFRLFEN